MNNLFSKLAFVFFFISCTFNLFSQIQNSDIKYIEENCAEARNVYLDDNPDVKKNGMSAWSHYENFGKREGRKWPRCLTSHSIDLNTLEEFFGYDVSDRNLEIYLKSPNEIESQKMIVQKIFDNEFVFSWADMNSSLFSALKVERNVMFIILSLIIIVAAFNIISGLTILVKNKTKDIAILKSIGVLNKSIVKIFFLIGVIIGTSATAFGIVLGVTFSIYIENLREFLSSTFNISLFPEEIYFLSKMPSEINRTSIFLISICSIIITIIVSIFPAFKAAKLDPIKALKYE